VYKDGNLPLSLHNTTKNNVKTLECTLYSDDLSTADRITIRHNPSLIWHGVKSKLSYSVTHDGGIILRWIFRKLEGVETGWSWLRIWTGGGHL